MQSQTTTTATTLSPRGVGWSWRHILDTADLHARASKSAEGRLSTWTWSLRAVTYTTISLSILTILIAPVQHTTSSPNLHMQRRNAQLLAASSNILRSQHGSVRGGLVAIGLDFHSTCHAADGFAAAGITQVSL